MSLDRPSHPQWIRQTEEGVTVELAIQPRSSRTRVVGEHDGRLKIQLMAPPVDGEANAALIRFIAKATGVPRRQVEISAGEASRRKTVRIAGADVATIVRTLASNPS